jgi:glutamyl-tRNA reductase
MTFQLIGVNHRTAPVDVRERLAISEKRLPEAVQRLAEHPDVDEAMIVSTCNRVELLARCKNGGADLRAFIHGYFSAGAHEFDQHLYEYRDTDAIRHLFRVTWAR